MCRSQTREGIPGGGDSPCKGAEESPGVRSLAGSSVKSQRDPAGLVGDGSRSGALNAWQRSVP